MPSDLDDKSRRLFYLVFLIIGPPSMILFGISSLSRGDLLLFYSLLFLAAGVISGWFFLLHQKGGLFPYRINAFVFALILIYIIYIGGEGGSKILWSYTFPLIVIFLFGNREGLLWCLLYLTAATLLLYTLGDAIGSYEYHS